MANKRVRDFIAETGMTMEQVTMILPEKTKGVQGLSDVDLIKLNNVDRVISTVEEVEVKVENDTPQIIIPTIKSKDIGVCPEGVTELQWLVLGDKAVAK